MGRLMRNCVDATLCMESKERAGGGCSERVLVRLQKTYFAQRCFPREIGMSLMRRWDSTAKTKKGASRKQDRAICEFNQRKPANV